MTWKQFSYKKQNTHLRTFFSDLKLLNGYNISYGTWMYWIKYHKIWLTSYACKWQLSNKNITPKNVLFYIKVIFIGIIKFFWHFCPAWKSLIIFHSFYHRGNFHQMCFTFHQTCAFWISCLYRNPSLLKSYWYVQVY